MGPLLSTPSISQDRAIVSKLSGLPELPASVGGKPIPDFINFEIVGDGKLPARHEVPPEFDFSIKKSPIHGLESGKKFDEGAVWHPLREVKFALSDKGLGHYRGHYPGRSTAPVGQLSSTNSVGLNLGHYRGHYPGRSTAPVGQLSSTNSVGLKLKKDEHIVGFRAYSNDNGIEGVRIWTNDGGHKDFGKVQGATERGKDPEAFFVPEHHEVVNFFGHTNDAGHIHGLGASYTRRLASLAARAPASNGPKPEIKQISAQAFMDAATQQAWAQNVVLNVYNFDVDYQWRSINHYDDNASISNGQWQPKTIATFKPADSVVFPPGFEPQQPLESVVTYLSMTWENDSTFMQGLGEGVVMGREDNQAGVALKYIVHYWSDNEIGLSYIDGNPSTYNLDNYYNNGSWLKALSTQASSQDYMITGHTPKLGGADDNDYYYDVSIGLPPHVVR
ncbi:hypothetical protein RSAG8_12669, partial [Rhizoctonia solani AG-8 WAC10335]